MPAPGPYPQLDGLDTPQPVRDAIKRAYDLIYDIQSKLVVQVPRSFAYASGVQSIATGANVALAFNRNSPQDFGEVHLTGPNDDNTQFVVKKAGLWFFASQLKYAADATGSYRQLFMQIDGATPTTTGVPQDVNLPGAVIVPTCYIAGVYGFRQGQSVRFVANHDGAGAINTLHSVNSQWGTMVWLRDL